jgi:hypothetical protein
MKAVENSTQWDETEFVPRLALLGKKAGAYHALQKG